MSEGLCGATGIGHNKRMTQLQEIITDERLTIFTCLPSSRLRQQIRWTDWCCHNKLMRHFRQVKDAAKHLTHIIHLFPVPKIQPVEEGLQGAAAVPVLVVGVQVAAISVVGVSGLKPVDIQHLYGGNLLFMTGSVKMLKVLCCARAQAIAELGMAEKAQQLLNVKQAVGYLQAVAWWWLHSKDAPILCVRIQKVSQTHF